MIFKNKNTPRPQLSGVQIICPHEMIIPVPRLYLQYNDVIFLFPVALWILSWLHLSGSWLEIHANQLMAGYWKPVVTDRTNEVSLCLVSGICILLVPVKALGVWGIWKTEGLSLQIQYPNGSQLEAGSGSASHVSSTVESLGFVEGIFPALLFLFLPQAKQLQLNLMARGTGNVRELLQLGRKDTKGQWVNQEGSEVPHKAAFHSPSAWRPHRNRNSPGWIRTADGAAAVTMPSYPNPQKWWETHF